MKTIELSDNLNKKATNRQKFIVNDKVYNILDELSLIGGFARFNLSLIDQGRAKRSSYHSICEWLHLFAFPSISDEKMEEIILAGYYKSKI